ncbi:MAG: hypothetical protein LBQ66_02280 [Planctomycetaceae bacterium]|nr:hypothetical protein [Planctomycetaceae bacterium]
MTPIMHPSSTAAFANNLFGRITLPTGGNDGQLPQGDRLTLTTLLGAPNHFPPEQKLTEDFVENGEKAALRTFIQLGVKYPFSELPELRDVITENLELPLNAPTVVETKLLSGTETGEVKYGQFPLLRIRDYPNLNSLSDQICAEFLRTSINTIQTNSLWGALIYHATQFDFMVVPRCKDVYLIPKWFTAWIGTPYKLVGPISENNNFAISRPISAAVVSPTSLGIRGLACDDTQHDIPMNLDGKLESATLGKYKPSTRARGSILVRQRVGWGANISVLNEAVSNKDQLAQDPERPTKDTPYTYDSIPAARKECEQQQFYDLLAQDAYYDEILKGNTATISTPISFALCPGSTVRYRTGADSRLGKNDKMQLEYEGVVVRMRIVFDTISASAITQYELTHVRERLDRSGLLTVHPTYNSPPFVAAPWCGFQIGPKPEKVDQVSSTQINDILNQ